MDGQSRPMSVLSSAINWKHSIRLNELGIPMKTKLLLALAAVALLPVSGIAADASDSQDAQLNRLLTEMNSAPSDQKISAIVTLLNKLVEQHKAAAEQAQHTPAPEKMKGMCMCCDMMKSDQSGQQSDQSDHSHH
jgi:hypothetical protein